MELGTCIAVVRCRGHPNVQLAHESTLELEERSVLTPRGDCIACISCSGGEELRSCATRRGLAVLIIFAAEPGGSVASFAVYGLSPGSRPGRLVARRSCHTADSIVVAGSAAAADAPRRLARILSSGFARCYAVYTVFRPPGVEELYVELCGSGRDVGVSKAGPHQPPGGSARGVRGSNIIHPQAGPQGE
ncbi:DUF371 domain-containing protein [Hyperthermus butylicus]|uniref:Conserved archaeal protein, DUF371 n=1 Tax=Hyperthermus butylicus (strain DSM 5456 / JCM 9403 / PLM1-5) TaxID=415426 RepID=A2BJJ4_HYPBU|nr:DUF371 domain-containing protein [Hyperthermus butylicus]ABM80155.1 conserved archaeal protein, DUF371 [Hyperthermus butylicus DSM 5456]